MLGMKRTRRKFISSVIGSTVIGGMAGCMESKNEPNQTNNSDNNDSNNNINNKNQTKEDGEEINKDLSPYVESFTYEFNCSQNKKEVKNIGKSDTNKYNFSGIESIDSDCYIVNVNADVINRRLNVQIELSKNDQIKCQDCESQISYAGVITTTEDQDVEESELNIVYN